MREWAEELAQVSLFTGASVTSLRQYDGGFQAEIRDTCTPTATSDVRRAWSVVR